MHAEWAEHLLSTEERKRFEEDGFFVVPDALPSEKVAALTAVADRRLDEYRTGPDITEWHILNLHDLVGRDDVFLDLIDWPTTFPKVFGCLGWHIQLFHTQLIVSPPAPEGAAGGPYGWHQDTQRTRLVFETGVTHPRVSVKVAYFLRDVSEPGRGNLCVVPGSHLTQEPERDADGNLVDGIEILAAPGDAVVFDRRIWHSASTNTWTEPRTALFYGYSYRWLRPKSAMDFPELLERVDPIRRQLLGWATSANGYFDPQDEDVPLRHWIRENIGADAVVP
jgi:ectoine hydroxylase-related dioxygenase (phytanoyl-CoA dioxygenase family)